MARHAIYRAAEIVGSMAELARILGVTRAAVHQWTRDGAQVPIERCYAIEVATGGAVTRRDLRPRDWRSIWPELAQRQAVHAKAPRRS